MNSRFSLMKTSGGAAQLATRIVVLLLQFTFVFAVTFFCPVSILYIHACQPCLFCLEGLKLLHVHATGSPPDRSFLTSRL